MKRKKMFAAAAATVLAAAVIALALPVMMNSLMDASLRGQPVAFAEAPPAGTADPYATPAPEQTTAPMPIPTMEATLSSLETQLPVATTFSPDTLPTLSPEATLLLPTYSPESEADMIVPSTPQPPGRFPQRLDAFPLDVLPLDMVKNTATDLNPFSVPMDRCMKLFAMLGGGDAYSDGIVYSFILADQGSTLYGVSAFPNGSLPVQKLLSSLTDNLLSDPVYIPEMSALQPVLDQPIRLFRCTAEGDAAVLTVTYGQMMRLAALREAAGGTAAPADAAATSEPGKETRLPAQRQANSAVIPSADFNNRFVQPQYEKAFGAADQGVEASRSLFAEKAQGIKAPDGQFLQPAVTNIREYRPDLGWAYAIGGHHLAVVDMASGSSYTFTTDLLTGQVIGAALENSPPFLDSYGELAARAQAGKDIAIDMPDDPQGMLRRTAPDYLENIIGTAFTPENRWAVDVQPMAEADQPPAAWRVTISPIDSAAFRLDPAMQRDVIYVVYYNADLSLKEWYVAHISNNQLETTIRIKGGEADEEHDLQSLERALTNYDNEHPSKDSLLASLRSAYSARAQYVEHAMDILSQTPDYGTQFSLKQYDGIRHLLDNNGEFSDVLLIFTLENKETGELREIAWSVTNSRLQAERRHVEEETP